MVVSVFIGPRIAWIEYFSRHMRTRFGHCQTKNRMNIVRNFFEAAVKGFGNKCAGMR